MPKLHNGTHDVEMTLEQMEQLARDAAICAGACFIYMPRANTASVRVMAAAQRILTVLKLED